MKDFKNFKDVKELDKKAQQEIKGGKPRWDTCPWGYHACEPGGRCYADGTWCP